ncbi:MAG: MlaD family protein [Planctomycetota bacterium]
MNEQRMQFAVGLVTLVAGFALAAIIIWFGEFQFVFQPRKVYYVTFTNALGAEPGMPVRRAGMRVGEVRRVEYSPEWSLVVLEISLDGNNDLREGDEPTLKQQSLLGDFYVDIDVRQDMRGKPDRPIIPPGATLEGRPAVGIEDALGAAENLVPNANDTLKDIQRATKQWTDVGDTANRIMRNNEQQINTILEQTRDSTERLAKTLESINNILDPTTQENLRVTMQNVRDASEDLTPVIDATKKTIEQISTTTGKLDEVASNLATATKPLAERSASTLQNLDESVMSLNEVLGDLKVMVRQFRTQDGTLKRLATDPSLYQNLDDAAVLLVRNLAELEKVMGDLKVFSDKIARHPGELGVQGVLTKDKGLKDVPPGMFDAHNPKRGPFQR